MAADSMTADPHATARAEFEAAVMEICDECMVGRPEHNHVLALYDQAAQSAAAVAPDAAVDKGADLIDRAKLKESIRNMERARHTNDERWNIVQLIDAQPSASIAPDAAVEIEGEVVDTGPHGDLWSFIHIRAELPLPIGTRVSVVRLPSPEADPNG